jgi:hypothetical protein
MSIGRAAKGRDDYDLEIPKQSRVPFTFGRSVSRHRFNSFPSTFRGPGTRSYTRTVCERLDRTSHSGWATTHLASSNPAIQSSLTVARENSWSFVDPV